MKDVKRNKETKQPKWVENFKHSKPFVSLLVALGIITLFISAQVIYELLILVLAYAFSALAILVILGTLLFVVILPIMYAIGILYDTSPKVREWISRIKWLKNWIDKEPEEVME